MDWTVVKLKNEARRRGLTGYSSLNKSALLNKLGMSNKIEKRKKTSVSHKKMWKLIISSDENLITQKAPAKKVRASFKLSDIPVKTNGDLFTTYYFVYRINTPPDVAFSSKEEYKTYINSHKGDWAGGQKIGDKWVVSHVQHEDDVISPVFHFKKEAVRWIKDRHLDDVDIGVARVATE
jgi:hypothetical protein